MDILGVCNPPQLSSRTTLNLDKVTMEFQYYSIDHIVKLSNFTPSFYVRKI